MFADEFFFCPLKDPFLFTLSLRDILKKQLLNIFFNKPFQMNIKQSSDFEKTNVQIHGCSDLFCSPTRHINIFFPNFYPKFFFYSELQSLLDFHIEGNATFKFKWDVLLWGWVYWHLQERKKMSIVRKWEFLFFDLHIMFEASQRIWSPHNCSLFFHSKFKLAWCVQHEHHLIQPNFWKLPFKLTSTTHAFVQLWFGANFVCKQRSCWTHKSAFLSIKINWVARVFFES